MMTAKIRYFGRIMNPPAFFRGPVLPTETAVRNGRSIHAAPHGCGELAMQRRVVFDTPGPRSEHFHVPHEVSYSVLARQCAGVIHANLSSDWCGVAPAAAFDYELIIPNEWAGVPLNAFAQPSWVGDTRIDPKQVVKKLTSITLSVYCEQVCRPANGMVILDSLVFEKQPEPGSMVAGNVRSEWLDGYCASSSCSRCWALLGMRCSRRRLYFVAGLMWCECSSP